MKKALIILAAVIGVFIVLSIPCCTAYNGMVTSEENVDSKWSDVESEYQRRSDLIPNLISTVKGYADHEKSTLDAVISARAKATSTTVSIDNLNEESLAKYQAAQGELSSALGRLLAITENYPDLKANQNFSELQAQLEGTENRIKVSRKYYNEAAQEYNVRIRKFPASMIASMSGFDKKPYFKAEEGAEKAPKVEF